MSFLGGLAFAFTDQIVTHIADVEKKYTEEQQFYDAVEKQKNERLLEKNFKG